MMTEARRRGSTCQVRRVLLLKFCPLRRALDHLQVFGSVFGGTLGAIDEDIDLLLPRIEPQAQLFPYSCEY